MAEGDQDGVPEYLNPERNSPQALQWHREAEEGRQMIEASPFFQQAGGGLRENVPPTSRPAQTPDADLTQQIGILQTNVGPGRADPDVMRQIKVIKSSWSERVSGWLRKLGFK